MNIPYTIFQFFAGEDPFDLNLPVIAVMELVYFFSVGFRYHEAVKANKNIKPRLGEIGWFMTKMAIALVLGTLSIKLAIFIGIYTVLFAGKVSVALSKKAETTTWKVLHNVSGIFLIVVFPVALFVTGFYLHFILELLFGIASFAAFMIFESNIKNRASRQSSCLNVLQGFKESPRHAKVALTAAIVIMAIWPVGLAAGPITVENIMLTMRDDVRLATTIYRPAWNTGGLPVILIRTPYNKDNLVNSAVSWYNKGYVVVVQDTRGLYASEGTFDALMNAGNDGYDTCAWIVSQRWCDGRIGSIGGSALSMVQYPMAGAGSPGLCVQYMEVGTPDIYDVLYRGGKYMEADWGGWIRAVAPTLANATIDDFLTHPNKTSPYWDRGSLALGNKYANVSTRAVHLAGWYDLFQQNTIDGFSGYYYNGSTFARGHQKLVVGPWVHAFASDTTGQLVFPKSKEQPTGRWRDAIFTESLQPPKFSTATIDALSVWNEPDVAYYVMGANEWRYANEWPIAGYTETPLYLHDNGTLAWPGSSTSKNFSYVYDPQHPMQTIGGTNLVFDDALVYNASMVHPVSIGWGPWDQRPLLNRPDVLVFNSSTITQDVEVVGKVKARLWIASNCTDTDFVAKLCDVYPDGRSMLVVDGIISVRKRNGLDKDELIVPGNEYEIEIDLWSTAYRFIAGHKIQLVISSSNAPKYQPCPNNGGPLARNYATFNDANNTILVGGIDDSCIVLPIA